MRGAGGAGGAHAWRPIKAPAAHRVLLQARGRRAGLVMEARLHGGELSGELRLGILFDLCESRNYGLKALIL